MGWHRIAFSGLLLAAIAGAQTLNCDFQGYKALDGLKAEMRSGALELSWEGERGQTLRAILAVNGGQPVVRELAVRRSEEHTSELQSLRHLVCRLLLEKKKHLVRLWRHLGVRHRSRVGPSVGFLP